LATPPVGGRATESAFFALGGGAACGCFCEAGAGGLSEAGCDLAERRGGEGLVGSLGAEVGAGAGAGRESGPRAGGAGVADLEEPLEAGAEAAAAGVEGTLRGLDQIRGGGAGREPSLEASRLGTGVLGGGAAGYCLLLPALRRGADPEAFGFEGAALTILPVTLLLRPVGMTGGESIPPLPQTDLNLSLDPYRASQSPVS